jgi:hypothetical protein
MPSLRGTIAILLVIGGAREGKVWAQAAPMAAPSVRGTEAQGQAAISSFDQWVKVQSIRQHFYKTGVDPVGWWIELLNVSPKGVTAVGVEVTAKYSDGSTKVFNAPADFAATIALVELPLLKMPANAFQPNDVAQFRAVGAPAADGSLPVSATAVVTMVIFYDRTAYGPQEDIQRVLDSRVRKSKEHEGIVAILEAAAIAPDPSAFIQQKRQEALDKDSTPGSPSRALADALLAIQSAKANNPVEMLRMQTQMHRKQAEFLHLHSTLPVGADPEKDH